MRGRKRIHEEREKEKHEMNLKRLWWDWCAAEQYSFHFLYFERECVIDVRYFTLKAKSNAKQFLCLLPQHLVKRVNTSLVFCALMRAAQSPGPSPSPHTRLYTWCELATPIQRNEIGINDDLLSLLSHLPPRASSRRSSAPPDRLLVPVGTPPDGDVRTSRPHGRPCFSPSVSCAEVRSKEAPVPTNWHPCLDSEGNRGSISARAACCMPPRKKPDCLPNERPKRWVETKIGTDAPKAA